MTPNPCTTATVVSNPMFVSIVTTRKVRSAGTRGVMVSGIMVALDIAPTLHFVKFGLKFGGEEWIKVMDECIAPNCAALMEPGRYFLLVLDNASSHACRLAGDHCKTVLRGTVEFQPRCSPDLPPLNFFVERAQDTAPSAPSSQLRALLTRVDHRTWTGSRWMFEKMGKAWVRRLQACVGVVVMRFHIVPLKDTA